MDVCFQNYYMQCLIYFPQSRKTFIYSSKLNGFNFLSSAVQVLIYDLRILYVYNNLIQFMKATQMKILVSSDHSNWCKHLIKHIYNAPLSLQNLISPMFFE
jgi:hypothetical protein